jgi:hypothetical protein
MKNESYLKSIRSITSTSSSCTNSTNMSDDLFRTTTPADSMSDKVVAAVEPIGFFNQPPNDDYFYYYQRVYSEINDSDVNTACRKTILVPNAYFNPNHGNTIKIPVLNNFKESHFNFA